MIRSIIINLTLTRGSCILHMVIYGTNDHGYEEQEQQYYEYNNIYIRFHNLLTCVIVSG